MIDLSQRHRQPETIDRPDLDPRLMELALRGLQRINFLSGSVRILWPAVRQFAWSQRRPIRLLDIACGGGDVTIALARLARSEGLAIEVDGCDVSPAAIAFAERQSRSAKANVRFFHLDANADALPFGYDVVCSSLFLHHLDDDEAIRLFQRIEQSGSSLVLVNDLVRSRAGYALAYVGTRILSACRIVHEDGLRSVEGAFTIAEARRLAVAAGWNNAAVEPRFPQRFLLTWRRS